MKAVGLLGGTFDPPHIGHLAVAVTVGAVLGLDEVRLLVASDPWQKSGESSAAARVALVEAAVADDDRLGIETIELDVDGPTYTVDTLTALRQRDPDVSWYFIAGADAIAGMETWHRARELPDLATLLGVDRPGTPRPTGWPADHVTWVDDAPRVSVSSTDLRARARAGLPLDHLVTTSVRRRIEALRLYRSAP